LNDANAVGLSARDVAWAQWAERAHATANELCDATRDQVRARPLELAPLEHPGHHFRSRRPGLTGVEDGRDVPEDRRPLGWQEAWRVSQFGVHGTADGTDALPWPVVALDDG